MDYCTNCGRDFPDWPETTDGICDVCNQSYGASVPCLTLRQPWVWAIEHAGKRIENRGWTASYRGPLLIHAGLTCTGVDYDAAADYIEAQSGMRPPPIAELRRGGLALACMLSAVLPPARRAEPWRAIGAYGWRLDNVTPLRFREARGAQGLFRLKLTLRETLFLRDCGILRRPVKKS